MVLLGAKGRKRTPALALAPNAETMTTLWQPSRRLSGAAPSSGVLFFLASTFQAPKSIPTHGASTCTLHYDATVNASRWEHLDGQRDYVCVLGNSSLTARGAPCNAIIHATDGWLYVQFPRESFCCKCTDATWGGFIKPV